jgi:hypothetical protein
MTINLNYIYRATLSVIIYLFFISFYLPILNFNDLYILKFLPDNEEHSFIFKIENQSIILGYIYISINLIFLIFFLNLIFKKFKTNIEVTINTKKNFLTNIILTFITSILIFLKFNNSVNENLYHMFVQLLFFHTLISLFIFSEKKYLIYYLFVGISIVIYKTLVTHQIFIIYLFFISSLYFFYIIKKDSKKLLVYSIILTVLLFSLNYKKVFLRADIDANFENRCSFVKIKNINSCGKYSFSSYDFRNEIVPVPPSTFKLIYYYPKTNFEYSIYSGINKGFERLLKMNYLASNIATMNNDFENLKTEFLKGESYKLLITKFIPRTIYRKKPVENWGQIYAKKFGYLPHYDNTTSINLDSINESYINFGFYGALIYPLTISLCIIIILLLVNIVSSEFKLIIISSIPIFAISSMEGNTSGWVGGFVSWIILIIFLNYLIKYIILRKILN